VLSSAVLAPSAWRTSPCITNWPSCSDRPAPSISSPRPHLLTLVRAAVGGLAGQPSHRQARDSPRVAPRGFPSLLALEVPSSSVGRCGLVCSDECDHQHQGTSVAPRRAHCLTELESAISRMPHGPQQPVAPFLRARSVVGDGEPHAPELADELAVGRVPQLRGAGAR
jgi:hypothetical protein